MSFQRKSTIAIILIATLVIGNQTFIQYWLSQKKYDAKVINVSGRQRMLSQKTMALIFNIELLKDNQESKTQELQATFTEWKNAHDYLINGNTALEIKGANQTIKKELESLTPTILFVENLLKKVGNLDSVSLTTLRENQSHFLFEMNNIVKDFEKESNDKFSIMIWVQLLFSLIIIAVIIFELKFVFQPITERLKRQNKALINSNKTLEEYAYIASHDLRSPLQNVLSFLGLLKRTVLPKFDDKEKLYFKYVEDSAERMNQTTIDLLHYSTSNDVNRKPIETEMVIQSVIDDLQTLINNKKAKVTKGELPKVINVDENLFRLLLQNLVTNALKFVPNDVIPQIDIVCESNKNEYVFCVRDNGIGISKDNLDKIFKIFKRLHSKKEYEGTGIGLSMCKRIIEGHQGEIWVESEPNNGSQFYFSIPK